MAHEVKRAQPVLSSPKDHSAFHASVVLMCDCDTLRVYDHERESVLLFLFFSIHVDVLFCFIISSKLGWTDTYGVGMGDIIAEYIKKHMIERRSYSTCSPHQVWTLR